ncbi:Alpha/Beta hydrolase protein [Crucibulum laeve]|uniref:Alpha/Beta hydrolase protein n=1 Tax=Crucibulum laeve TaxID=68775 RepID=A0A5C3MK73_9AGAR|nr:Alpha/Beta hydrolase protein [Crucibulum laeve]
MSYAFRHQPFKGLYLTYELLATLFIRFPLWALLAIPRSWRPRNSWSFKRAFLIRVVRHVLQTTEHTGPFIKMPNHLAITPGVDVNGVWVGAVPQLIGGELKKWAEAVSVTSVRVPGYWTHKKGSSIKVAAPPQPGEKVVYALHGGAYIRLSAHPTDPTAAIARGLLKHVEPVHRVFSVEYRLSADKPFKPAFPFPAALLDALAGYNYLVNVIGFSPSDIIIAGDSAGGNLALALTRYLVEYRESSEVKLPGPPSGLLLLSPWGDLGKTQESLPHSSATTRRASDYVGPGPGFNYAKRAFLGSHGPGFAEHNRYISPASLDPSLSIDFIGFPRTFIVAGGAEVLVDQIRTLGDRMIRDLGEGNGVQQDDGKVRYYEAPDGVHDYLAFTWHDPERTDTLTEISKWVCAS